MAFYATNGKAVKSLGIDDVLGAGFESSLAGQFDLSPRTYYTLVPFIRRAVRIRANAIAGVPVTLQKGSRDISKRPEFAALMDNIAALIWKTEFALCLSQYGAYWKRSVNAVGLNPTPEWLLPHVCWPYITAENGLEYIRYVRPWGVPGAGRVDLLSLDEVVHFWYPSLERANWPGSPPGVTALAAASALANRDAFVASYFKRGAIKGVLLSVPSTTRQDERDKLRDWWRQIFAGIANAWRSIVISADVKPVIIGEGLKDTESEALTQQYRQDVAAAFEVPETKLLANAANYATARQDNISFHVETVFPELDLILTAINKQWLRDAYDAELVSHPEQTEAMQDAQVQQATAITELVGKPILTVDEGRAWLGMEPMPKEEEPAQPNEAADYQAMEDEETADELAAQAAEKPSGSTGDPERVTDAERVADPERISDAERMRLPSKAILTGRGSRAAERATLRADHRMQRETTRERHKGERALLRTQHVETRQGATDAALRLRLVQRQRSELTILDQRHAAERSMLRGLHAAERGRMRDRHAVERAFEGKINQNGHAVLA